jgi:hypothetical protein
MVLLLVVACNNGPKVIAPSAEHADSEKGSGVFSQKPLTQVDPDNTTSLNEDLHTVVVTEILPTSRYVYLKVTEGEEQFWIAVRKQNVKKGETYFYRGGLLKVNFESAEHNRVFEKVYLVANLLSEDPSNDAGALGNTDSKEEQNVSVKEDIPTHTEKIIEHKGSVKIAELVKDPKKYEGHTVLISGECVKVNANIMGRNWIHLRDGSQDDFDLVITTRTFVPEGNVVTVRAVVALNKDFGAGYKYDLILENGTIVQ